METYMGFLGGALCIALVFLFMQWQDYRRIRARKRELVSQVEEGRWQDALVAHLKDVEPPEGYTNIPTYVDEEDDEADTNVVVIRLTTNCPLTDLERQSLDAVLRTVAQRELQRLEVEREKLMSANNRRLH